MKGQYTLYVWSAGHIVYICKCVLVKPGDVLTCFVLQARAAKLKRQEHDLNSILYNKYWNIMHFQYVQQLCLFEIIYSDIRQFGRQCLAVF